MTEEEILAGALRITDLDQRAAFIAEACGADGALRERVEGLLKQEEARSEVMPSAQTGSASSLPKTADFKLQKTTVNATGRVDGTLDSQVTLASEPLKSGAYFDPLPFAEHPPNGRDGLATYGLPNFEIVGTIGRGGMGIVFKAIDKKLKRQVAIKVLAPQLAANDDARKRFLREAQLAAGVRHENVVTIYSVDEADGVPFLVMELINGESLQDRLKRGPLRVDEIVTLGIQIASGLEAAHRTGMIHRDIKPANILLEESPQDAPDGLASSRAPRVKITDFGLARVSSESGLTQAGYIAGTPQYMSPEQANGQPLDHRSDLFSLGSVLYALCTGQVAFRAESAVVVLRRVTDHDPDPIQSVNPEIPQWLCEIINKLLAKSPEDRFQTAREVADRLLLMPTTAGHARPRDETRATYVLSNQQGRRTEEPLFDNSLATELLPTETFTKKGSSDGSNRKRALIAVALFALAGLTFVVTQGRQQDSMASRSEPASSPAREHTTDREAAGAKDVSKQNDPQKEQQKEPGSKAIAAPAKAPRVHPLLDNNYEWTEPQELGPGINGGGIVDHACISSDGLLMVTTRYENGRAQLWWSVRQSERDPFPAAAPMPVGINTDNSEQTPFLSRDGLSLWFASNRPSGAGGSDLYVSRRKSTADPFEMPVSVGPTINSPDNETSPFVTADELTLLFASGKPRQIFQAQRKSKDDSFGTPQRLANINDGFWQEFPRMSDDGLTLVLIATREALGRQRLWAASRPSIDADFNKPTDLGSVNRGVMSGAALSGDETTVYFSTSSGFGSSSRAIWMSRRVKKQLPAPTPEPNQPTEPSESDSSPPLAKAPFDEKQARAHQAAWAKHLGTEIETTNSIGQKMIVIPPGEFLMGAVDSDADALLHEKPQHLVRLTKPFAIGATEITNRQFRQFVEATNYVTQAQSDGRGAFDVNPNARRASSTWNSRELKERGGDEYPVRCVSWEDARRFCEWLTQKEGRVYRLPTEAEWEFACRAGTVTRYSFGNDLTDSPLPPGSKGASLQMVAQLPANPFGLFDMHGNVNEICWDSGRAYTAEAVTNPQGSLEMNVPAAVRGGAVSSPTIRLRSSNRYLTDARQFPETNFATVMKGFRVVAEFSPPSKPAINPE